MRQFGRYLILEYKRSLIVFAKSFKYMLLMVFFLGVGMLVLSRVMMQSKMVSVLDVGVVISPEDEAETKMVTQFVSAMESVRSICSLTYMDQETAMEQLRSNQLQAVIVFPDTFYNDVNYGKNTLATVYFSENSSSKVKIFQELLGDGISLLQTAEAGVYAVIDEAANADTVVSDQEIGDIVAYSYIYVALDRERLFEQLICSPIGETNYVQYYYTAAMLLLLLMEGLNFGFLYQDQSRAVEQKLAVYGLRNGRLFLIKIIVMMIHLWMLAAVMYGIGCGVNALFGLNVLYWDITVLGRLWLLSVGAACHFHLVYAVVGHTNFGAIVLLTVNAGMVLCSGLLIPLAYLPDVVQKAAVILPLTCWHSYSLNAFFGTVSLAEYGSMLLWIVVEAGIGVIALCKRA